MQKNYLYKNSAYTNNVFKESLETVGKQDISCHSILFFNRERKMNICLPISAELKHKQGICSVGTCFLLRGKAEGVKLVTCAHLATQDIKFSDFSRWPSSFQLHIMGMQTFSLPLFVTVNGQHGPTFQPINTAEGAMVDLVALTVNDKAISGVLSGTKIFDVTSASVAPEPGEKVTSYGFPNVEKTWPYQKPKTMDGAYCGRIAKGAHEARIGMVEGHSGGPVLDGNGKLLGMGIGQQGELDRIIPVDILELVVR
ncbi:trypsin-like peptidase domain-containing protein [Paracoccus yeei]|uniref:trypsin-like peptidase domain-containing protein n=1 Tax=Paracoccus yeei TaxID=147645 RepID=UPI0011B0C45D|nr:trypsin-like peptidase domain-containing protein [Paracoccus yeei]